MLNENSRDAALVMPPALVDQVYHLLWRRIARGDIRPGEKLSDLRLSEELGVSRTPIREALHRLAQDGIVQMESRRGFSVTVFSSRDVGEIYDIRSALEVLAVRLAFPYLTDGDIIAAQQALDAVVANRDLDDERFSERFLEVDRQFHETLVRIGQNRRLATIMASLRAQIGVFQVYGTYMRHLLEMSIGQHQAILAALGQHDQRGAERAMEDHILSVKAYMLDVIGGERIENR